MSHFEWIVTRETTLEICEWVGIQHKPKSRSCIYGSFDKNHTEGTGCNRLRNRSIKLPIEIVLQLYFQIQRFINKICPNRELIGCVTILCWLTVIFWKALQLQPGYPPILSNYGTAAKVLRYFPVFGCLPISDLSCHAIPPATILCLLQLHVNGKTSRALYSRWTPVTRICYVVVPKTPPDQLAKNSNFLMCW